MHNSILSDEAAPGKTLGCFFSPPHDPLTDLYTERLAIPRAFGNPSNIGKFYAEAAEGDNVLAIRFTEPGEDPNWAGKFGLALAENFDAIRQHSYKRANAKRKKNQRRRRSAKARKNACGK